MTNCFIVFEIQYRGLISVSYKCFIISKLCFIHFKYLRRQTKKGRPFRQPFVSMGLVIRYFTKALIFTVETRGLVFA